ncbi:isopentenyl-diphosphate Delta-isomerase [Actinophytocola oryzae]|uniref:Isopentenyl-diphosphate Delta-isomerase n=1 Tax=Actinophytocola oryzae TaxID=502181 RepID=A0A4R7VIJ4_9PSEU|nr:isopentenyl-diphosphate Delta-isomerase [Actinophytocola oryzae]TDV48939.1 isopentenyl-diphosphate delta-isomerase [Actinophytocola oryzae]
MTEQVVLLDEQGRGIGVSDKATVHHENTPLHLAFSCYVFNPRGELLVTRRARAKKTWPGVVTNTCCGHPAPSEPFTGAVTRRLADELGLPAPEVDLLLPRFRYRAEMPNGVVENELCPVFRAVTDAVPSASPEEVDEVGWMSWPLFVSLVTGGELAVSPWCREQVPQLTALGPDPLAWPTADDADLPAAARGVVV